MILRNKEFTEFFFATESTFVFFKPTSPSTDHLNIFK